MNWVSNFEMMKLTFSYFYLSEFFHHCFNEPASLHWRTLDILLESLFAKFKSQPNSPTKQEANFKLYLQIYE